MGAERGSPAEKRFERPQRFFSRRPERCIRRRSGKCFPFLSGYARLTENARKQLLADISLMRIRNGQRQAALDHECVLAAGIWAIKARSVKTANQVSARDGAEWRQSGSLLFLHAQAYPINRRQRKVAVDSEQQPIFKDLSQLGSALFQSSGIGIHPAAFGISP